MNGHLQFEEQLDLYALEVLEGEEKESLESHLKECPECHRKLDEARGRIALLALAGPPQRVPARVKERLRKQIAAESLTPHGLTVTAVWRWAVPALALLSALLVFFAVMLDRQNNILTRRLVELERNRQELDLQLVHARTVAELLTAPDTIRVTLVAAQGRPTPQGKVFYHPNKGLLFYAANLPTLTPGQTYQLWLVPSQGNPISAGIFDVDARGNGEVTLPRLPSGVTAKAFAVTVEPAGGVLQPTGPKVIVGLVS